MFKAAMLLSHQYNITIEGEFIGWQEEQTTGNIIDAMHIMCHAVSASNVVGVIGPRLSREAQVIAPFGEKLGIPIISYSATNPDLSDENAYPNFHRTVASDFAAARALAKLFIRYNWTSCTIIYQNDAFGIGGANGISKAFNDSRLTVSQMIVFDIAIRSIRGDLKSLLVNAPTRMVIVWADTDYTYLILQEALDSNVVGPQFTWILSITISLNYFNQAFYENLIGMFFIEPAVGSIVNEPINATLLDAAYNIWNQYEPESFPGSMNVDNYALFAFDATWTLIQSLQQLCASKINTSSSCLSLIESSDCLDRRFIHSKLLLDTVSGTEFLGVSGPIQFSDNVTDRITGLYYSAKNAQPSSNGLNFVPVLEYIHPKDWRIPIKENVIVWSGRTLTPPSNRALLKGVNLRIGIIESVPFTIVEKDIDPSGQTTIKYSGYVLDLIKLLRNKMKFIPIIELVPSNMTYDEFVRSVSTGVYDIAIGDVTVTSARSKYVDFSNAIFDNSLRIIIRTTSTVKVDLFSFLKPFSNNLWLLFFGTLIYAGILIYIMERKDNEVLQNRSILNQIFMSIWYSFGNVVGYGVDFHIATSAGRLLTVGLYILGLILVASYTANLASDLTIAKTNNIISGIDDIKSGKIPFNRIGIFAGSSIEDFYLREISNGVRNFLPLYSYDEIDRSLLAGIIDASFQDSGLAIYATNNIYCNLTLVGNDFDKSAYGIVMPQRWLYAQDLDVNILQLKEDGSLENLRQTWFAMRQCPDSSGISTEIGIEATSGLFLIFAVISILSLILFAWKKRQNIKICLFQLIYRKKSSVETNDSMNRRSSKASEQSQNYQIELPDISHF
ncbi:unnamed protein product [Rotaria sordida]|uniref:Ionotropic glutamate receptor C-terminal domain-containing protein n=1 Tax=Rotaria sordida TaxID=392033 RepID=A0A819TPB3_9BILA|nr:unnamed protein product [Rotaria sordida]CAF1337307.1 unnamed protein product [Rotaria sordida]CAF4026892.1 unnamed protein product [Rotaria sordida]CAF4078209.1 unnamed protein product [Rotaria sordida]